MPPYANVTIYFLKDIISGHKKCKSLPNNTRFLTCLDINNANVRHMTVPHYESLTINKIGEFCQAHQETYLYLPDLKEMPKIPRQWIINVVATLIGDAFVDWVRQNINDRN